MIYEVHCMGMCNETIACTGPSGAVMRWSTRDGAEAYIRHEFGLGSRNESISAWVVETAGDLDLLGETDPQPDPWADLAADIRRGRASAIEQAEAWQARAEQAEARVAELEEERDRLREALSGLLDTCGEHIEDAVGREDPPALFDAIDQAREVLATEVRLVARVVLSEEPDHA